MWDFLKQRASFEIFKVGMFINDAETRKHITDDLENILSSWGEKRITALTDLMVTIAGSPSSRGEIFRALRFLSNESGYKNNPFLMITIARTTAYRSETPAVNRGAIANAVKAANENLYNNSSNSALTKINRQEAAQINYWASQMYSDIGANDEATNRSWIERFLNVSDQERKSASEGDIINIVPPGQTVMKAPSGNEVELAEVIKRRAERIRLEQEIDTGKQDVEPTDPRSSNRTGTQFDETFNVEEQVWNRRDGNKPPTQSRPNTYRYEVENSRQLGAFPAGSAGGFGEILYLVLEYFRWQTFHRRMAAVTKYLAEKQRLESKIRAEKVYVVPFKPAKIEAIIKDFRRNGRLTANLMEKRLIVQRLNQLQSLLEESYAYWGK